MDKKFIILFSILVAIAGIFAYFVLFSPKEEKASRIVKLFYYNPNADKDETGNVMCSRNGLESVERTVEKGTSVADTVRLLLKGQLTNEEKSQGLTTEYPLAGFELTDSSLENGVLTLTFSDPQNKSGGGSCRVGILWFQIETTAKQFPEISSVRFLPEELFQP